MAKITLVVDTNGKDTMEVDVSGASVAEMAGMVRGILHAISDDEPDTKHRIIE